MQTINKKILIIMIFIVLSVTVLCFYLINRGPKISKVDAQNELQYAQIIKEDIETKPYIAKLPINTGVYTIIYSSVNKDIVVIFTNTSESIDNLKGKYSNEINLKLQSIGANSMDIRWETEN